MLLYQYKVETIIKI